MNAIEYEFVSVNTLKNEYGLMSENYLEGLYRRYLHCNLKAIDGIVYCRIMIKSFFSHGKDLFKRHCMPIAYYGGDEDEKDEHEDTDEISPLDDNVVYVFNR